MVNIPGTKKYNDDVKAKVEQYLIEHGFHTTMEIPMRAGKYLSISGTPFDVRIDEKNKKLVFCNYQKGGVLYFLNFDQLLRCEVSEDNQLVREAGIARTLIGAALGGVAGAIVASNTRKQNNRINSITLHVYSNKLESPYFRIPISWKNPQERVGLVANDINFIYRVYATLEAIIANQKK